jgi:hypothetical protein
MSLPEPADYVIIEDGEPTGWFGAAGRFVYEHASAGGDAADALRAADGAERMDTAVGRGGEIREGRVDAEPNEKSRRAREELSSLPGVRVVRAVAVTDEEADALGALEPRSVDTKSSVTYVSEPSDAPSGVDVRQDAQGRYYYVADEGDAGPGDWVGDPQEAFEVDVRDPEDIQDTPRPDMDDTGTWEGAPRPEITTLMHTEKAWVPYEGPRGGEGWKNVKTGRVEYAKEPPGRAIESEQELRDALDDPSQMGDAGSLLGEALQVTLAEDADVFAVGGEPAPVLVVEPGAEITFEVDAEGHPFYISRSPGGGAYTDAVENNVSVSNAERTQGGRHTVDVGQLTLRVTNGDDRLYYACSEHEGMGAAIEVTGGDHGRDGFGVAQKAGKVYPEGGMSGVPDGKVARADPDTGELFYWETPDNGGIGGGDASGADEGGSADNGDGGSAPDPSRSAADRVVSLLDALLPGR